MASTDGSSPSNPAASQADVVAAIMDRVEAGEAVDVEEQIALHPDLASVLRPEISSLLRGLRSLGLATTVAPPLPAKIGGYRLEWRIGRGGEGSSVFRAVQETTGQVVAIKVLPPHVDERQVQRFLLQRQFAALHHEHIVPVLDAGDSDGFHYLTMELMAGGSLAAIVSALARESPRRLLDLPTAILQRMDLQRDNISRTPAERLRRSAHVRWVVATVRDVALALHQAHQEGLIHRDVKPSNILLTASGSPRLADFGLARRVQVSDLTRSGETPGTRPYMSPEQVDRSAGVLDHRTDLYSLGATMFELLALQRPFDTGSEDGISDAELIDRIRYERPADLRRVNPAVPRDLAAFVAKLLEKAPEDRFASAAEVARQLDRFLDGAAMSVRPVRWPTRLMRRARHHPVVAAAMAGSGALLLLASGVFAAQLGQEARVSAEVQSRFLDATSVHLQVARTCFGNRDFEGGENAAAVGVDQSLAVLRVQQDPQRITDCLCDLAESALMRGSPSHARAVLSRVPPESSWGDARHRVLQLRANAALLVDPASAVLDLVRIESSSDPSSIEGKQARRRRALVHELAKRSELRMPGVIDLESPWSTEFVPFVAVNGDVGFWRFDGTSAGMIWGRTQLPGRIKQQIEKDRDLTPRLCVRRWEGVSSDAVSGYHCLLQVRGKLFRFALLPAQGGVRMEPRDPHQPPEALLTADPRVLGDDPRFESLLRTLLEVLEVDETGRPERVYVATRSNHSYSPSGRIDFLVDFTQSPPLVRSVASTESATLAVHRLPEQRLVLGMGEWGGFGLQFLEQRPDVVVPLGMQRIGFVSSVQPLRPESPGQFLIGKGSVYRSDVFFGSGGFPEWDTGVHLAQIDFDPTPRVTSLAHDADVDERLHWHVKVAPSVQVTKPGDGDPVHLAVLFCEERTRATELRVYETRVEEGAPWASLLRMRTSVAHWVPLLHRDIDGDGDEEVFGSEAGWSETSDVVALTVVGMERKP